MAQVILITGAGSGFGLRTANTLARAGHTVYGGLHTIHQAADTNQESGATVHDVVLDITDDASVAAAVQRVIAEQGRLDVLIHNAGHMGLGPAEAFSPAQFHQYFEINTVGAHRLNQAVLPLMRAAHRGHIVWVSSTSARGGSGPLLAPYFAAKAAMHSLALSLADEIAPWGIETTVVVPGIFTSGTNHFATAGQPAFPEIAAAYMDGPLRGADTTMLENVNRTFPKDATPQLVADAIRDVVAAPRGRKPFRVPVDPFQDGADAIMALAEEKHDEFLKRCGIFEQCQLALS